MHTLKNQHLKSFTFNAAVKIIEKNNFKIALTLFRIYLSFIFLQAGFEKLTISSAPEWFIKQFENTFFNAVFFKMTLGGLPGLFYSLGFLESLTGVVLLFSVIKFKNYFLNSLGLILAEISFLALGVGLRVSHQYSDAAQLFFYFCLTVIIHELIKKSKDKV